VQVLTLVQIRAISVKVLAIAAQPDSAEHWHPPVGDDRAKRKPSGSLSGTVFFYVQGENTFSKDFLVKAKKNTTP